MYDVLVVLDLKLRVNSFILAMTCMLMYDYYNFSCYGCSYPSSSYERNGRALVVIYATDINLAIGMSFNNSHVATCYSLISSPIHE